MAAPFDVPDGSDANDSMLAADAARRQSVWRRHVIDIGSLNCVGAQEQRLAEVCRTIVALNIRLLTRHEAERNPDSDLG